MEITYHQYISNPAGSGASVLHNKDMYKQMYTSKFDAIMMRENGKLDYKLFENKKKGIFYCYIKIPSEVVNNFYYDVIVELRPSKNNSPSDSSLKYYNVRFFSNDPSFVFTFCYAFNKNGLFITELAPRMDRTALTHTATVKNPRNEIGYVKSLYFAFLAMDRLRLFTKSAYASAEPFQIKLLLSYIQQAEIKIRDRIEKGKELTKTNHIEKIKTNNDKKSLSSKITVPIKFTTNTSSIKNTKFLKHVKRK